MTADELHDRLWLFYGEALADIGVQTLWVADRPSDWRTPWDRFVVVWAAGRLPSLSLPLRREWSCDGDMIVTTLAHAARKHWMYQCALCREWFLKACSDEEARAEHRREFGREVGTDEVLLCDECYEIVMAGNVAAMREAQRK